MEPCCMQGASPVGPWVHDPVLRSDICPGQAKKTRDRNTYTAREIYLQKNVLTIVGFDPPLPLITESYSH